MKTIQLFNPKVFVAGGDGDDDINDVAAMGGVNLAEESQRMATDSFLTSSALRSCGKDETFLQTGRLHHRVARLCKERGLEEPPPEVINLVRMSNYKLFFLE